MKFLKYASPIVAISISMFSFMTSNNGWDYNDKFIDDFFTLLIFSGATFIGSLFYEELSSTFKYKLITSLCSFWMFISSIYHWLTQNEWNSTFIILSLINIIALGLFFVVYAKEFFQPYRIHKSTLTVAAVFALIISSVSMVIFRYYCLSIVCAVCVLLLITNVVQNYSERINKYE